MQSAHNNHSMEGQERPKLEDILGGHSFSEHDQKLAGCNCIKNAQDYGWSEAEYNTFAHCSSYQLPTGTATTAAFATIGSGENGCGCMNGSIGLFMNNSGLRNQPAPGAHENYGESSNGMNCINGSAQALSLSMGTGSQLNTLIPLLSSNSAGGGGKSSEENKYGRSGGGLDGRSGAILEAVPRKSINTFGRRIFIYRGSQGVDGSVGTKLICGIIAVEGRLPCNCGFTQLRWNRTMEKKRKLEKVARWTYVELPRLQSSQRRREEEQKLSARE